MSDEKNTFLLVTDDPKAPKLFALEYLKDLSPQGAYTRTFGRETTLDIANRFMKKPKVQAAISAAMDERMARVGFDADKILEELARVAFSDIRELFDDDGNLRPLNSIRSSVAASIASVEVIETPMPGRRERGEPIPVQRTHKIRAYDKLVALDKLGRHMKLFGDKIEMTGKDGAPLLPAQTDLELARRIAFVLSKVAGD